MPVFCPHCSSLLPTEALFVCNPFHNTTSRQRCCFLLLSSITCHSRVYLPILHRPLQAIRLLPAAYVMVSHPSLIGMAEEMLMLKLRVLRIQFCMMDRVVFHPQGKIQPVFHLRCMSVSKTRRHTPRIYLCRFHQLHRSTCSDD